MKQNKSKGKSPAAQSETRLAPEKAPAKKKVAKPAPTAKRKPVPEAIRPVKRPADKKPEATPPEAAPHQKSTLRYVEEHLRKAGGKQQPQWAPEALAWTGRVSEELRASLKHIADEGVDDRGIGEWAASFFADKQAELWDLLVRCPQDQRQQGFTAALPSIMVTFFHLMNLYMGVGGQQVIRVIEELTRSLLPGSNLMLVPAPDANQDVATCLRGAIRAYLDRKHQLAVTASSQLAEIQRRPDEHSGLSHTHISRLQSFSHMELPREDEAVVRTVEQLLAPLSGPMAALDLLTPVVIHLVPSEGGPGQYGFRVVSIPQTVMTDQTAPKFMALCHEAIQDVQARLNDEPQHRGSPSPAPQQIGQAVGDETLKRLKSWWSADSRVKGRDNSSTLVEPFKIDFMYDTNNLNLAVLDQWAKQADAEASPAGQ
jgi:hypothetical protein